MLSLVLVNQGKTTETNEVMGERCNVSPHPAKNCRVRLLLFAQLLLSLALRDHFKSEPQGTCHGLYREQKPFFAVRCIMTSIIANIVTISGSGGHKLRKGFASLVAIPLKL